VNRKHSGKRSAAPQTRADKKAIPCQGAHVLRRIAAIFYDGILLLGVLFALTAMLLTLNRGEAFVPGSVYYDLALIVTSMFFFTWFWSHGGQTLGMRAWRIRLEKADGQPCDVRTALTHMMVGSLFGSAFGIGWLYALFNRDRRALQDILCGTRVVKVTSSPP
jgi:uncharacterized RDD family membrane protein YckC